MKKKKNTISKSVAPQKTPLVTGEPQDRDVRSFIKRIWTYLTRKYVLLTGLATIIAAIAAVLSIPFVSQYLNSGQLEVSIGNDVMLNQESPTYFFFRTRSESADTLYLLPVQFRVTNASNTHDDKIVVSIKYEKKSRRSFLPEDAILSNPSRPIKEQIHEIVSRDSHDYVNYSLSYLSPHDYQQFTDAAFATRSLYDPNAPILYTSGVGLDLTISTYSQQDIRRSWDIRYRGLNVRDDDDILKVLQDWYAKQIAFDIREKSGFWGYIPKLLFKKEVVMYAYAPNFQYVSNLNAFFPSEDPKHIVGIRIKPYSWQLLFRK